MASTLSVSVCVRRSNNEVSELAMRGPKNVEQCLAPMAAHKIIILDAVEIVVCTNIAKEAIHNIPEWSAWSPERPV